MPALRKYRVFICHAWDYSEDYYRIVGFLDEAPLFNWEDCSVPVHDPLRTRDLEYELRNQMRDADVFLIIAGMYAAHHDWMDFEMQFARRIGRPIIGILRWGSERVPQSVQSAALELVGWNSASIVAAIRRQALASGS